MTPSAKTADPMEQITRSKQQRDAEAGLAQALTRVDEARGHVQDTETARDALQALLRSGVADVSAADLAHADAECARASFLALAARDAVPVAEDQIRQADLDAAWDVARTFAKSEAVVGWREADQAAKDARIRADALRQAYIAGAQTIGQRLRALGAPHVHTGNPGDGYCARGVAADGSSSFVTVLGYVVDGINVSYA